VTRYAVVSLLALAAPLWVSCTERHRLGGRYDDGLGGEAGASDPSDSGPVSGGGAGSSSAVGGSDGGGSANASGGAPPSAGAAGRGGAAGGDDENLFL
jgi:hypothetical protein